MNTLLVQSKTQLNPNMKFFRNWFRIWDFIDGKTSYLQLK